MGEKRLKRNSILGLWKFIAALLILGHHANIFWSDGNYPAHGGYIYVEFFFLLSGYYFMRYLEENKAYGGGYIYVWRKIKKLFPYTTIAFIIHYILECIYSGSIKGVLKTIWKLPLEILYLTNLHITSSRMGQLWYIAAMLFCLFLLTYIYSRYEDFYKNVLIWVFPVLWYACTYMTYHCIGNRGVFLDLFRAAANLLLGGLIYIGISKTQALPMRTNICRYMATLVEWSAFLLSVFLTYKFYRKDYDFFIVFLFIICIYIFQAGYACKISSRFLDWLGEISTTIYIVHITVRMGIQNWFSYLDLSDKYLLYYSVCLIYAVILWKVTPNITQFIKRILISK